MVHWIQSRTVPEIAFSSPSGDGLVLVTTTAGKIREDNFRPRLGMGWFNLWVATMRHLWGFRPRLGMGWFNAGLVVDGIWGPFSSPLGDGLVQRSGNGLSTCVLIFVPAWGWVGSLFIAFALIVHKFLNKSKRF
ncbi:hypothetical protein DWW75_03055 [Ruminococcus sp. AF17-11]|nr:hypothetical protein DWW75_03055 [Ruminococcus sp. AF17-11]